MNKISFNKHEIESLSPDQKNLLLSIKRDITASKISLNNERAKQRYAMLARTFKEHQKCADLKVIEEERDYFKKAYELLLERSGFVEEIVQEDISEDKQI